MPLSVYNCGSRTSFTLFPLPSAETPEQRRHNASGSGEANETSSGTFESPSPIAQDSPPRFSYLLARGTDCGAATATAATLAPTRYSCTGASESTRGGSSALAHPTRSAGHEANDTYAHRLSKACPAMHAKQLGRSTLSPSPATELSAEVTGGSAASASMRLLTSHGASESREAAEASHSPFPTPYGGAGDTLVVVVERTASSSTYGMQSSDGTDAIAPTATSMVAVVTRSAEAEASDPLQCSPIPVGESRCSTASSSSRTAVPALPHPQQQHLPSSSVVTTAMPVSSAPQRGPTPSTVVRASPRLLRPADDSMVSPSMESQLGVDDGGLRDDLHHDASPPHQHLYRHPGTAGEARALFLGDITSTTTLSSRSSMWSGSVAEATTSSPVPQRESATAVGEEWVRMQDAVSPPREFTEEAAYSPVSASTAVPSTASGSNGSGTVLDALTPVRQSLAGLRADPRRLTLAVGGGIAYTPDGVRHRLAARQRAGTGAANSAPILAPLSARVAQAASLNGPDTSPACDGALSAKRLPSEGPGGSPSPSQAPVPSSLATPTPAPDSSEDDDDEHENPWGYGDDGGCGHSSDAPSFCIPHQHFMSGTRTTSVTPFRPEDPESTPMSRLSGFPSPVKLSPIPTKSFQHELLHELLGLRGGSSLQGAAPWGWAESPKAVGDGNVYVEDGKTAAVASQVPPHSTFDPHSGRRGSSSSWASGCGSEACLDCPTPPPPRPGHQRQPLQELSAAISTAPLYAARAATTSHRSSSPVSPVLMMTADVTAASVSQVLAPQDTTQAPAGASHAEHTTTAAGSDASAVLTGVASRLSSSTTQLSSILAASADVPAPTPSAASHDAAAGEANKSRERAPVELAAVMDAEEDSLSSATPVEITPGPSVHDRPPPRFALLPVPGMLHCGGISRRLNQSLPEPQLQPPRAEQPRALQSLISHDTSSPDVDAAGEPSSPSRLYLDFYYSNQRMPQVVQQRKGSLSRAAAAAVLSPTSPAETDLSLSAPVFASSNRRKRVVAGKTRTIIEGVVASVVPPSLPPALPSSSLLPLQPLRAHSTHSTSTFFETVSTIYLGPKGGDGAVTAEMKLRPASDPPAGEATAAVSTAAMTKGSRVTKPPHASLAIERHASAAEVTRQAWLVERARCLERVARKKHKHSDPVLGERTLLQLEAKRPATGGPASAVVWTPPLTHRRTRPLDTFL